MSASERLRELVNSFYDAEFPSTPGEEAPTPLVRALPEIVAVVKAAEKVSAVERTGQLPDFMPLALTLAALEDKLGSKNKPYITSDPITVSIRKDQT